MPENSTAINFTANIDGLIDSLATARGAIDNTFDLSRISSGNHQKPINDLFHTVERSSDQAISAMIRGTQSWQSALQNAATNIEIRFAQLAARKVLNWVQSESLMTQSTQVGNLARAASDKEASSTGIAAIAEHVIASIMNNAKSVFGGIFSFLAPVMGPAAAGPASAGSAAVSALAGGVLYAETGAWHIADNTLAYLHAGEMVVPQPFADSLRNAGGTGGGGNFSITINAIDTQTGAQFLKNNASAIASALSGQVRNFNSHVPAWKS
jgi:hypothetical protein